MSSRLTTLTPAPKTPSMRRAGRLVSRRRSTTPTLDSSS